MVRTEIMCPGSMMDKPSQNMHTTNAGAYILFAGAFARIEDARTGRDFTRSRMNNFQIIFLATKSLAWYCVPFIWLVT